MSIVTCFVASAMTAIHGDLLVLGSYCPWSEVWFLVSLGQIISTDPPLLTDGWTDGRTDRWMDGRTDITQLY